jgi:hypothetical protein
MRHYTHNNKKYPSVTTILDATADYKTQMHLQNWLEQPGNASRAEAARFRGEYLHDLLSKHVRGISYFVDTKYEDVWNAVLSSLGQVSNVVWAEGSLDANSSAAMSRQTINGDSMNSIVLTPAVWSDTYGFAGCPDLIATRHGKLSLIDFKTSDCYYQPRKPPFDPQRGEEWKKKTKGWYKYNRTVLQLCAYKIAIKETLGLEVESMAILVANLSPIDCCFYTLSTEQIQAGKEEWLKRVAKYYKRQNTKKAQTACKAADQPFPSCKQG